MTALTVSYSIETPRTRRRHAWTRALVIVAMLNIPSPVGAILYWWVFAS